MLLHTVFHCYSNYIKSWSTAGNVSLDTLTHDLPLTRTVFCSRTSSLLGQMLCNSLPSYVHSISMAPSFVPKLQIHIFKVFSFHDLSYIDYYPNSISHTSDIWSPKGNIFTWASHVLCYMQPIYSTHEARILRIGQCHMGINCHLSSLNLYDVIHYCWDTTFNYNSVTMPEHDAPCVAIHWPQAKEITR